MIDKNKTKADVTFVNANMFYELYYQRKSDVGNALIRMNIDKPNTIIAPLLILWQFWIDISQYLTKCGNYEKNFIKLDMMLHKINKSGGRNQAQNTITKQRQQLHGICITLRKMARYVFGRARSARLELPLDRKKTDKAILNSGE